MYCYSKISIILIRSHVSIFGNEHFTGRIKRNPLINNQLKKK